PGHGSNAISLSVEPRGATYDLWFDVNSDVAATSTAQRVAGHLQTFLQAALRSPERPLASLPLLGAPETQQVRAAGTGPSLPVPVTGGCHARFERAAGATPQAIALISGDIRLSYSDLNASANQLARK